MGVALAIADLLLLAALVTAVLLGVGWLVRRLSGRPAVEAQPHEAQPHEAKPHVRNWRRVAGVTLIAAGLVVLLLVLPSR